MTTKNPRLTITLEPALAAQLRELSRLTGNSQSKLISELLQGSTQVFDRLIQVLQAAEGAKASIRGKLADDLERAQTKIEAQFGLALESFGEMSESLLEVAEAVNRRRRKAPSGAPLAGAQGGGAAVAGAERTPISNRGVRSDQKADKAQNRGGRK